MPTNFHLAPPTKTVDGLLAVPIDIQNIQAAFVFDGATNTATADATITYIVGPTAGNPFFDLRQNITQAWLDGAVLPVAKLAHHAFGAGPFDNLRVIESVQAAGSTHTLRVQYTIATPMSQNAPTVTWSAGPTLEFGFRLSDLNAARYAEAWLPSNLLFDQFSIDLELRITNTAIAHSLITNGTATDLGSNHWTIAFPARFNTISPLLEVRRTSTVQSQTGVVNLPLSGPVTIEAWKLSGSAINLLTEINNAATFLTDNENDYGAYVHGNRFVVFFNGGGGGMEYEGGTTTSTSALNHETFHSWFARGVKPAAQSDGWWDEAYTSFHDDGASTTLAFDFSDSPILLCSRDPWQRITPTNSYTQGNRFWQGMASMLGVGTLNTIMSNFYKKYRGQPASTQMIEEFILTQNANDQTVDAFHRFVYGFSDGTAPELWMKDDPAHTGTDDWGGTFWDSPDLWIRNDDDNVTTHQSPQFGRDNWFYARVRNKSTAGTAKHFVVTFTCKEWAGTEFRYPGDFLPAIAAKAEFELGPGETRIVKAKWPANRVPATGTHACILASVISRQDHPVSNKHVWEHNNLAQKNTTVVAMEAGEFFIIPVLLTNIFNHPSSDYALEVWRDREFGDDYPIGVIHPNKDFFRLNKKLKLYPLPQAMNMRPGIQKDKHELMDCGGHLHEVKRHDPHAILTSRNPAAVLERFPDALLAQLPEGKKAAIKIEVPPYSQKMIGLKIDVPKNAKRRSTIKTHLVQRHTRTKEITGGITVVLQVK